jgi:hypothetical protein
LFNVIEKNWLEFVDVIKTGVLPKKIIEIIEKDDFKDFKENILSFVYPNPKRAEELKKIFVLGFIFLN